MEAVTYSPCTQCRKLNRVAAPEGRQAVCGACKTPLPLHGWVNAVPASALDTLMAKSPLPVVTDFWAPWCAPCRAFAPVFEQAAKQLAGSVVFAKVDTEANPLASTAYGIQGIPTLVLFRDGQERARQSGAMPLQAFVGWLQNSLQKRSAA